MARPTRPRWGEPAAGPHLLKPGGLVLPTGPVPVRGSAEGWKSREAGACPQARSPAAPGPGDAGGRSQASARRGSAPCRE